MRPDVAARVLAARIAAALGWLLLLILAGAAALPLIGWAASHKPPNLTRELLGAGGEMGLDVYLFLLLFGRLPGARAAPLSPRTPPPWGVQQAVWALLGFAAMLAAGGLASTNILIVADLALDAAHAGYHADFVGRDALLAAALGGEAAAALWITWYLGRAGAARLREGSPSGIAWRPAPPAAYGAAGLCAGVIIALVAALFHFIPPHVQALQDLPMAQLMDGGGWEMLPLLALIIVVGPVVEELTFRGAAFAGFASRLGPLWASVITTAVFIAVHAGEKLHYLPGFIDVGLVAAAACWLRLRYASIRPGILLHILYNAGLIFAAGLFH